MRPLSLLLFTLAGSLFAAEPAYPLWDGQESVASYAKKVNLPPTQTLDLGNGVKLDLVLMLIRARMKRTRLQFSMGLMLIVTFVASIGVWGGVCWQDALKRPYDFPNEHPAHLVTLTQPFYMGKFAVTQEQYQAVTGATPSHLKGKDNPVEQVSWDDAQAFCKKLTEQTKQAVRLPTEAEWEYACRAGTTTTYHSGDSEADLARVAWYYGNSKNTTHPVGQKEANIFGLYDMHGNIWQWCQDWYGEDYYGKSETENPQGPDQGAVRLLRGGSWFFNLVYCRSAYRLRHYPVLRSNNVGFRIVLVPAFRTP